MECVCIWDALFFILTSVLCLQPDSNVILLLESKFETVPQLIPRLSCSFNGRLCGVLPLNWPIQLKRLLDYF